MNETWHEMRKEFELLAQVLFNNTVCNTILFSLLFFPSLIIHHLEISDHVILKSCEWLSRITWPKWRANNNKVKQSIDTTISNVWEDFELSQHEKNFVIFIKQNGCTFKGNHHTLQGCSLLIWKLLSRRKFLPSSTAFKNQMSGKILESSKHKVGTHWWNSSSTWLQMDTPSMQTRPKIKHLELTMKKCQAHP